MRGAEFSPRLGVSGITLFEKLSFLRIVIVVGENMSGSTGINKGLAGLKVGSTKICTVGHEGDDLHYRGYSILDLTEKSSFEEVAYLLIHGELPKSDELWRFSVELSQGRELLPRLVEILELIPKTAHPMDVLRTTCSVMGTLEPEDNLCTPKRIATRLLGLFPAALLYWYQFTHASRQINLLASHEESTAKFFMKSLLLRSDYPESYEQMMNVSLILYAEHEFNASTYAARVTTSTLSDFYSAITSAIGTLRGPLHGGANEAVMKLISSYNAPDAAEKGVLELLAQKAKVMGFGHRVYKVRDPRSDVIKKWSKKLADEKGDTKLYEISERIEEVMKREKNLFANLDFYSASAYAYAEIPTSLFTPIFVVSRTAGWSAHILEQRADNRLIRPLAEYEGPQPRGYLEIKDR